MKHLFNECLRMRTLYIWSDIPTVFLSYGEMIDISKMFVTYFNGELLQQNEGDSSDLTVCHLKRTMCTNLSRKIQRCMSWWKKFTPKPMEEHQLKRLATLIIFIFFLSFCTLYWLNSFKLLSYLLCFIFVLFSFV